MLRCAGLIGAVSNDVCGVGVAPRAKLGGQFGEVF